MRILLADDSEHNITVARDTLLTYFNNAEIAVASSGAETMELVKQRSFDIILMDVRMPNPDGFECTRLIRSLPDERKASTPIYAFTASVIRSDIQKCLDAGMNGYIPKPFADSELISPVAERINALPDRTIGKDKHAKPRPTAHEMFVKLIPLRLQTLEQAIDQRDFKAISDVVHLMRPQLLASGWSAQEPQLNAFDTLPKKEEEEAWMLAAQELAERLQSVLNERLSNLP
jgi:CheY-like chemotaxis protein